jgi:hypothetical protein
MKKGCDTFNFSVHVSLEEKVSASISRDGGINSLELSGSLTLTVNDNSSSKVRLQLKHNCDSSVQFKTHPNIDKALWTNDLVIGLRDATRPYPIAQSTGVLKWRQSTNKESSLPLSGLIYI